jgi:asparagine synthase (glutamine-hydrolysing)
MPGIAVIVAAHPSATHERQLRRMAQALRTHADEQSGFIFAPELGVCGAWVAPARSFAARQSTATPAPSPLAVNDPAVAVAFAGECFGADTDGDGTLARRSEAGGETMVAALNGLFAGLIVDRRRGQALLFNDRYGSERLYACEHQGVSYVASRAGALLAVRPELRAFDDSSVAQFLAFGSVLGGRSLFRGVELLPGASLWRLGRCGTVERTRYFRPAQWEALPTLSAQTFETRFEESFRALLPEYLREPAQLGLSLTGGLDTRMILACLPRGLRPALAYTYAAEGSDRLLDARIAGEAARHCGIAHRVLDIGPAFLGDFRRQLDRTVRDSDGCAGVLGAHETWLSEQARRLAPLRLTGNYGSEVLRSMSTFKRSGPDDALLDPGLAERVAAVVAEQAARRVHPVTHAAFEEVPWHLYGTLAAARAHLGVRTPYLDNRVVELAYQAPTASRQGSAAAMRLIRNNDAALAALPTDRGVSARPNPWRRLLCGITFKLDYWHKEGLPDALRAFDRPLAGLEHARLLGWHKFLAYRLWFRGDLATHAADVIGDARTRRMPYWNVQALEQIVPEHVAGRRNRLRDIHAVLTLEAVQRTLLEPAAWNDDNEAPASNERSTAHALG